VDIFESATRTSGDLAGVFEYDDTGDRQSSTAYFYLYRTDGREGERIIDAIHISPDAVAITAEDITVRWGRDERWVGLFILGKLQAAFDTATGKKYSGERLGDSLSDIPWS
jgi:hypothetical protein